MLLACADEAASSAPLVRSDPWPIVESQLDEVPGPLVILDTGAVWLHVGAQAIAGVAETAEVGVVTSLGVLGSTFADVRFERDFVDRAIAFGGQRRQLGLLGTHFLGTRSLLLSWDDGLVSVVGPEDEAGGRSWRPVPAAFVGTHGRRLVVPVLVGDETVRLLIDTGAVSTMLRIQTFSRAISRPAQVGTSTVGRLGRLVFAEQTFTDVGVVLVDDDLSETLRREAGDDVAGVLGMNVLGCSSMLIDYGLQTFAVDSAACGHRSDPLASVGLAVRFEGGGSMTSALVITSVHPDDRASGIVAEGWRLASVDGRSAPEIVLAGEFQVATSGRVGTTHRFAVACSTCSAYHDVDPGRSRPRRRRVRMRCR
jgi:hypothetical protein